MFKNLHELIATMPDEKSCRDYLIKERWNNVVTCPYCDLESAMLLKVENVLNVDPRLVISSLA